MTPKGAFARVQRHLALLKGREGLFKVIQVCVFFPAFDEHIINIYLYVSSDFSTKHLVDQPLVSGSWILQPKRYYFVAV